MGGIIKILDIFKRLSKKKKLQVSLLLIIALILIGIAIWKVVGLLAEGEPITNTATMTYNDGTDNKTITSNSAQTQILPAVADAILSLFPASGSYNIGQTFDVSIKLDTARNETSGIDAIITYNPADLEVQDADSGAAGIQIQPGTLYDSYPQNSVISGKISFSAIITTGGNGYSGSGTVAVVTFKALRESAKSQVNFGFTNDSITDSNVKSMSAEDILGSVVNGSYALRSPQAAPNIDIKANNQDGPITISYGSSVILSWNVSGANSCIASGDWSGEKPILGSEATGELTSSKTYTLTCAGSGGSDEDSIIINVTALDQPIEEPGSEPGKAPGLIERVVAKVKAAPTGAIALLYLIVVSVILSMICLIYIIRKPSKNIPPTLET